MKVKASVIEEDSKIEIGTDTGNAKFKPPTPKCMLFHPNASQLQLDNANYATHEATHYKLACTMLICLASSFLPRPSTTCTPSS